MPETARPCQCHMPGWHASARRVGNITMVDGMKGACDFEPWCADPRGPEAPARLGQPPAVARSSRAQVSDVGAVLVTGDDAVRRAAAARAPACQLKRAAPR